MDPDDVPSFDLPPLEVVVETLRQQEALAEAEHMAAAKRAEIAFCEAKTAEAIAQSAGEVLRAIKDFLRQAEWAVRHLGLLQDLRGDTTPPTAAPYRERPPAPVQDLELPAFTRPQLPDPKAGVIRPTIAHEDDWARASAPWRSAGPPGPPTASSTTGRSAGT